MGTLPPCQAPLKKSGRKTMNSAVPAMASPKSTRGAPAQSCMTSLKRPSPPAVTTSARRSPSARRSGPARKAERNTRSVSPPAGRAPRPRRSPSSQTTPGTITRSTSIPKTTVSTRRPTPASEGRSASHPTTGILALGADPAFSTIAAPFLWVSP